MPRIAGQIDLAKNEAILDAAVQVLAERGAAAPIEEIARRAGVSKQTIYNHYGSKADLVRAIVERRVEDITAPLDAAGAMENPAEALAGFARVMLETLSDPQKAVLMRSAVLGPADVRRAMYEAGPQASRARLADFLAAEHRAGRLVVPDAAQASEFFAGMVVGSRQIANLLGMPRPLDDQAREALAHEAAARFLKAYGA